MTSSTPQLSNADPQFWDQRYEKKDFAYGQEPNVFLKERAPLASAMAQALSLADGEGRNGTYLAQLGYKVTSIDFSPAAKIKALSLAKQKSVDLDYHLMDLNQYHLQTNQWDLIASIFYQPLSTVRKRHYKKVFDALKPQGVFILETKVSLNGKDSDRYPSVQVLVEELSPLEIVYADESERVLNEGAYHQGVQRTVQIFAKKA
jgi:SAM-dependent methyltransferase